MPEVLKWGSNARDSKRRTVRGRGPIKNPGRFNLVRQQIKVETNIRGRLYLPRGILRRPTASMR